MQHKVRLLASSALLFAAALGTSAHAQSKSATAAAANNTIEELVVTAEKRTQSLQDVPVAISAFTSANRDLVGINTIQDMTNFTPGLNYSSQLDRTSIRGVGRLTNAHPIATAVAVYDDGIFTTSTVTAGKTPIFTDRVEVLRGPQGTLYGRNSIGGAINIISRRPTEDFYAEVRATVANYDRTLLEAAISGPLAPDLQFRLAGNWEKQRDGWFTNVVPGMPSEGNVIDQFYVEGQLQAKFGDHMDGWVKVGIAGWNNGGGGPGARAGYSPGPFNFAEFGLFNVNAGFACSPGGVVNSVVNTSPVGCANPASSDPRKFASNVKQSVSLDENYDLATNLTYHFDGADLKYVGGGSNYHYTLIQDNGGGTINSFIIPPARFNPALPIAAQPCPATVAFGGSCPGLQIFPQQSSTYSEDYHNFSHELDLSSNGNGALQWLGGLYYYREGYKQPVFVTMPDQPQVAGPVIGGGQNLQSRLYDDRPQFQEESYAAFGQLDWKFADQWKATLGLRYSHDHEYGTESVRVVCFATTPCQTTPELLGPFTPAVDITSALTYTATLPQGVVNNGKPGGVTFAPDGTASRAYDANWSATTGTAGVQWDPNPDTMVYARYSRGYKQGGFASGVTSILGQFPYTAPEHINDYEVGLKKDFGRKLQTNLALFYYDYNDLQAPLTVANNTGGLAPSQSQFINVPKSVSAGVELETTWAPIDNLRILFNYSYNDTHIDQLTGIIDPADPEALQAGAKPLTALTACTSTNPAVAGGNALCDVSTGLVQRPQNLAGNALPQAPRNKVAINVLYTWDFEKGSLTPSVDYVWRSEEWAGLFQRSYDASPSWDQWDARVTWKDKDNKFSVIAYIKNIGNTLGYDGGASGTRNSGVYPNAAVAAAAAAGGVHVIPGLAASSTTVNGVLAGPGILPGGITQGYNLTPPRTYGVEFQYRF